MDLLLKRNSSIIESNEVIILFKNAKFITEFVNNKVKTK